MIKASLVTIHILLFLSSAVRLRKTNYSALNFADGCLFGSIFFVGMPLVLILWDGEYQVPAIHSSFSFDPVRDWVVTLNLFIGWASTLLLSYLCAHRSSASIAGARRHRYDLHIIFAIYVVVVAATFLMSGKLSGGHWAEKMTEAFQQNVAAILFAALKNSYRAIIFGMLIFLVETKQLSIRVALGLGVMVVAVDLGLTFNRITAAYMLVMALILLRRHMTLVLFCLLVILPPVSFASDLWTEVRATAITNGFSLEGFLNAVEQASLNRVGQDSQTVTEASNAIFETSNIIVFAYIVDQVPNQIEPMLGWTLILRPLAIFVPSTFWPTKPPVFGTIIGDYMMGIPIALNSTLFGEAYCNFYLLWPFVLFVLLYIFNAGFEFFRSFRPYCGHLGFFAGLAIGRMEVTVASVALLATAVLVLASACWAVISRSLLPSRMQHSVGRVL